MTMSNTRPDPIGAVRGYLAARAKGSMSLETMEQLVFMAGDNSEEFVELVERLENGAKLPKNWEAMVRQSFGASKPGDIPLLPGVTPKKKEQQMKKALPKKDKNDEPVKQAKTGGASKKQAGAGGKTRYTYPAEQGKQQAQKPGAPPPQQQPVPVPQAPQKPEADPADLANQLSISMHTLQRIAQRFVQNKKLDGRKGFISFMRTRLKGVANKHQLDEDYWGLIFDKLTGSPPSPQ